MNERSIIFLKNLAIFDVSQPDSPIAAEEGLYRTYR
jgi:hypothetical protein